MKKGWEVGKNCKNKLIKCAKGVEESVKIMWKLSKSWRKNFWSDKKVEKCKKFWKVEKNVEKLKKSAKKFGKKSKKVEKKKKNCKKMKSLEE